MSLRLFTHLADKSKVTVRELAELGALTAILMTIQIGLAFLPNIELVSLLVIVYTLVWGRKTLYVIYAFAILEGVVYGFGIWWINYLYVWTILFIVVCLCKRNKSVLLWAVISAFFGLAFGALCAIPYLIAGGIGAGLAWWTAGIPFDIVHGVANFIVTLVLFKPLLYVAQRLSKR